MLLRNLTKKNILSKNAKVCNGFSKFIGLMFSKNQNKFLIFKFDDENIICLHMLFVFYPIDVVFLNKSKIAIEIKENFKPFAFYKSKRKAMYAVELPNGAIKKTKAEIGDEIDF